MGRWGRARLRRSEWVAISEAALFFGIAWLLVSIVAEKLQFHPRDAWSALGCAATVAASFWLLRTDQRHTRTRGARHLRSRSNVKHTDRPRHAAASSSASERESKAA